MAREKTVAFTSDLSGAPANGATATVRKPGFDGVAVLDVSDAEADDFISKARRMHTRGKKKQPPKTA